MSEAPATPRVAVIVPCFNDGATLRETLASIQEPEPVELAVVDDGSSEPATLAVLDEVEADGVRVIHLDRNRGLIAARMAGLEATSAPYVFPLDADDDAVPGALSAMADVLDADPEAGVCFGDYIEFGESNLVRAVPHTLDPYRVAYTNEYPISSLIRRSVLEEADGWTFGMGRLVSYEDWNLWMKLAARGVKGVHLGENRPIYRRRLHPPAESRLLDVGRSDHERIYAQLKAGNPDLFAKLGEHRRASDMSPLRKAIYPVLYGGRKRYGFERRVKAGLDRLGVWTLRR